jgi:NAD(P)H dehydrogenase (quinone)
VTDAERFARILHASLAADLADADAGLVRGELYTDRSDLATPLGRPATTRREAGADAAGLSAAVAAVGG